MFVKFFIAANKGDNECEMIFVADKCVIKLYGIPPHIRPISDCIEEVEFSNGKILMFIFKFLYKFTVNFVGWKFQTTINMLGNMQTFKE